MSQERKLPSRQHHPARKLNERQVDQVLLQWLDMPKYEEESLQDKGLPWPHRRDGIQRVDFAVDVAHQCPPRPSGRVVPSTCGTGRFCERRPSRNIVPPKTSITTPQIRLIFIPTDFS